MDFVNKLLKGFKSTSQRAVVGHRIAQATGSCCGKKEEAIGDNLFLPCIAQFLMSVFILFFSFSVGFMVNLILNILGISI